MAKIKSTQPTLFADAPFAFADRFLQDHAGQIISEPRTAILELIANSYDAGATEIHIDWPSERGEPFRIRDNGIGMTKAEFERRWRTLCYDREAEQGTDVVFPKGVKLLQQCDVHTLLRLPTGIFYAQGVKTNVLFFDAKPAQEKAWTKRLWVYDLRTNMHFTLKTSPLKRSDLDEFVACYKPGEPRDKRRATWSDKKAEGRWRSYDYDELIKRDKINLDLFWLKDESLGDSADLPSPDVLAQEIADDLETALEQFQSIAAALMA